MMFQMEVFFVLVFSLLLVTIVTSFSPRTITDKTETTTYDPCEKSLPIDFNTYQNSFEMTMKSDDGTVYPGAWQALKYSGENGLKIMAQEDEIFNMSFILKNCNGTWTINTIAFKTTLSKKVQLEVEEKVEYTWLFVDYLAMNDVSTSFIKQLPGDGLQLVLHSAKDSIFIITDLYIEVFCDCSQDINLPTKVYESSTLTIPTQSMPVPNNCPVGYTPIEYQYSGYGSKEFRTTINDILNGSDILEGSKKDVIVTISDFVAITRSNPSETFMLVNLRMVATDVTMAVFTFTDANNISQNEGLYPSTSEVFYHMGVGRLSELLRISITFKSLKKEIQIGKLIMSACIVKESSTSTIPTHSMPEHCPNAFIIDYNQSSINNFVMDITDEGGQELMSARNSLLHGPGLAVPVDRGQIFNVFASILEPCSTTWYYRSYQFGLDWAAAFKVRVDSNTIATSEDFVLEDKYFTEKDGFFPGTNFELIVERNATSITPTFIYDLKLVACCDQPTD